MSINVLIVDDSQSTRSIIKKILRMAKVDIDNVYEAENGEHGLDVLSKERIKIDLMLLDINMPVMNGIEMVEKMKKSQAVSKTPIIFISSDGSDQRLNRINELGDYPLITKPFHPYDVIEVIHQVTNNKIFSKYQEFFLDSLKIVLETSFFAMAEPASLSDIQDKLDSLEDSTFFSVFLPFSGDIMGSMEYYIPHALHRELTGNALGSIENDLSEQIILDNLKEFANIVCGHFISNHFAKRKWEMSLPVIQKERFDRNKILDSREKWKIVRINGNFFFTRMKLHKV
ncbi:MAG: response regulator [Spirochaetota bacterium]|nr:response regulator [Spirochaetota bacterium]